MELDKAKFDDLLVQYEKATEERHKAENVAVQKKAEQSKVVEELLNLISPNKKLKYKGEVYSIVQRNENYFLRGKSDDKGVVG